MTIILKIWINKSINKHKKIMVQIRLIITVQIKINRFQMIKKNNY